MPMGNRRRIAHCLALAALLLGSGTANCALFAQEGGSESQPLNPFGTVSPPVPADARHGTVELSNGKKMRGLLYLTPGLRWRFYDEKTKRYLRLPLSAIRRIDASVRKEWMEREWRFKEAASNEKVYTGRSYPVRLLRYRVTLRNGRVLTGWGSTVLYFVPESEAGRVRPREARSRKRQKLIIQERQKGKPGEPLDRLVYIKSIVFDSGGERTHAPPGSAEPRVQGRRQEPP